MLTCDGSAARCSNSVVAISNFCIGGTGNDAHSGRQPLFLVLGGCAGRRVLGRAARVAPSGLRAIGSPGLFGTLWREDDRFRYRDVPRLGRRHADGG